MDGYITMDDFPKCMRAMGVLLNEAEAKKLVLELDPDHKNQMEMGAFFVQLARHLRDADAKEKLVMNAVGKLYVDPRLFRKRHEIDPSKEIKPIMPLSNLRSLLSSSMMGEPISEQDMESLLQKVESADLINEQGNVLVDDLCKVLTTPIDKAVAALVNSREFDLAS
jgi:Ca2+-binding EF-hand superfamily protein